jgi:surface polysaccharide O-acyltransferase-like enzyme
MAVFCAPLIFEDLYGLWILEANLRHVYSVLGLFSPNYLGIYLA